MARIRQNMTYSDTRAELREYKDARRGGSEDELWEDHEELIDHRRSRKHRRKTKPGCPGNDHGPHVYVWIPWVFRPWVLRDSGYEIKVCCGCEKRKSGGRSFRRKP